MKEIIFDIEKFSYTEDENADVSFIPMLLRRKLNKFGKAALYTLYNAYDGKNDINLVFASDYGDFERVEKLITQRKEEGTVSPSGFSSSVHNATIGLFSLLEKINSGYNSLSAGDKSLAYGLLEGILHTSEDKDTLFCYTESFGGIKSVSVLVNRNKNGEYIITDNDGDKSGDKFCDFIRFLNKETDKFASDLFVIKRQKQ